ncbi:hypothetical protein [Salinicoccus albus]|uniref:hypothetical protein n=1 Tax=Salinicoccus albus TaxID=418756 RepID=UPI00036333D7|nr:hypothetical protein [Salinicoccus albus]
MKRNLIKFSLIATIVLIISTVLNPNGENQKVEASESPNAPIEIENTTQYEIEKMLLKHPDTEFETQAAGTIAILFGGVLVGFLVSGGVRYVTGYSADYWVSQGIGHVHNTLSNLPLTSKTEVLVYPNGQVNQRCDGSGYCAIPSKLLPKENQ